MSEPDPGLATGLKFGLSNRLSISNRTSKSVEPPVRIFFATPRSTRLNHGDRSWRLRGAQSPAFNWMQPSEFAGAM
jgi:hypothetical protein